MKFIYAVFVFALTLAAAVVAQDVETDYVAPTELEAVTTYKPDDCAVTAQNGDNLKVYYSGRLHSNGKKFDSSIILFFIVGAGRVIKGWDEGLVGMCVKEKRTLTIPAAKAYGSRGAGGAIPPDSALVFDVELASLE
ncbi:hypothetical protein FISHEDRAFT_27622, partial [Fistulina hepatica ATCC 64428]